MRKATYETKAIAHDLFDDFIRAHHLSRYRGYKKLAGLLGCQVELAHFSAMKTEARLEQAIAVLKQNTPVRPKKKKIVRYKKPKKSITPKNLPAIVSTKKQKLADKKNVVSQAELHEKLEAVRKVQKWPKFLRSFVKKYVYHLS